MADVSYERKKNLSREEAAVWLTALAKGFAGDGTVDLPVGGGGTMSLTLPEQVRAEFEVEVDGDQVEIEIEFSWSTSGE
ncbi:MAG TPA: amphi-Trp domain-containing protein [Nocardioides sp.]|uniref:amphi-Trp domain-containing protein n=1 Tax=Nocardioides sp. TaxID=35761 RepID=UPI002BD70527|nr:amphi-Trp domain-containing protein [Nocardioides sp.]HQR26580.1 amphi-Trp domain-containing protein [Nocardioides sp.]